MGLESWAGSVDLNTPAGELLRRLIALLASDRPLTLTVFGSAPLQVTVDSAFTRAEVDVFCDWQGLDELVRQHRLQHADFLVGGAPKSGRGCGGLCKVRRPCCQLAGARRRDGR